MKLDQLLPGADARDVRELRDDSRAVEPGDVFVAVPGSKADGRSFIQAALDRGASAIVTGGADAELEAAAKACGAAWIVVEDVRRTLALMAARRFGAAEALTLVAVTGTNGKTTTTHVLESILLAAGARPGLVGTVHYRWPGARHEAPLTTPGALQLHGLFARMREAGCTHVVLEASSHALHQGRLHGCQLRAAALTNVTQDHLDYHGTMEAYADAKAILFRELLRPGDGTAVLFVDREDGRRMRSAVHGRLLTVAVTPGVDADVMVREATLDGHGLRAQILTPRGSMELRSPLVGDFNLQNVMTAVGLAVALGLPDAAIVEGVAQLNGVPGRLERVDNDRDVLCVVDYAHTPDGLVRAMEALGPLARGRLIVVFGCGGDRDPKKRPLMGQAVAQMADLSIVTSDNPRTEEPSRIIEMILGGMTAGVRIDAREATAPGARGVHVEMDRRAAIRLAVAAAQPGDVVLLAGKGHEDYQILGTTKVHFDDREEAAAAFASLGAKP